MTILDCGLEIADLGESIMMKNEAAEISPTEKLRNPSTPAEQEEGTPGAQNPDSEEIKDEQNPNTE